MGNKKQTPGLVTGGEISGLVVEGELGSWMKTGSHLEHQLTVLEEAAVLYLPKIRVRHVRVSERLLTRLMKGRWTED